MSDFVETPWGWLELDYRLLPRPGEPHQHAPETVCGIRLVGCEVPLFHKAVETGELVVMPELPVASPLPEAWKRWCSARGIPCREREVTMDSVLRQISEGG